MSFLRQIDSYFRRMMPPVTRAFFYAIVGLHFTLFLLSTTPIIDWAWGLMALTPETIIPRFQVWRLLSYGFLHANAGHLLGNALGLLFFGGPVEQRLGARRYAAMLLSAIAVAGLAHALVNFGQARPVLIGFSAADFAILVGCLIFIPNAMVAVYFFFPMRMKWFVLFYVALEVGGVFGRGTTGVSHLGHVMGALVGGAFIMLPIWWNRRRERRRGGGRTMRSQPLSMGHPGRGARASELYDDPHWKLDQ